ncbi:MAG: DNA mismatch repair endonuclease MutL [Clostridiales bacterium]|jgi:DNA mismatch repair protein MutL|nr:DNA mismatch repair endonuclease MutL [Clostridiales bacterium]MDY4654652.1 DNA mismatch repair endonuclease MutL [Eubacteriales bacterium]
MPKINLLDKSVYNQISAGEVVENPASIVKELVENSIDAGADSVSVSIENGGIKSIIVTDNGCGMEKEDLKLSILPHATSKIKVAADLDMIGTLGFRGEALASIAAVSEVTLKSKYIDSDVGNFIEVKGGEVVGEGICAISGGTQISVRSLFYNTPARYKFLKTSKGEESNVTALIAELIFANPDVSFTYTVDGNVVYKTYGEGLYDGIYSVYGDLVADNMIPLGFEENGYKLTGFTARPATEAIKNNRTKQTFIINGRIIEDATISAVIQNAYGEFLMKRTFPTVVLDMVIPFGMVDVNVHPNKREVRFADAKKINGIVYHTVKRAVEKDAEQLQKTLFSEIHNFSSTENTKSDEPTNRSFDVKNENTSVFAKEFNVQKTTEISEEDGYLPGNDYGKIIKSVSVGETFPVFKKIDLSKVDSEYISFADAITDKKEDKTELSSDNSAINENEFAAKILASDENDGITYDKLPKKPTYKIVGQIFDTYLILEFDEKIVFLDQHAAHERILFDKLIEECNRNVIAQDLLIPYEYPIDGDEREFLLKNKDNFDKLGFSLEIFDDKAYINSVPALLTNIDLGSFLREVLSYKTEMKTLTDSSLLKDRIAKYACRSAIKGGAKLTDKEIEFVVGYFFEKGVPLQCPHGRPTMIKFTRSDIEKFFGRKV